MELGIKDRIVLSSLFIAESDSETLLIQRSIREKAEFTAEENEKYKIKYDYKTGAVSWDNENEELVDINLSVKEMAFLGSRVEALDKEKKLTENNLDLALKIKEVVNG